MTEEIKRIKSFNDLVIDDSYLIFVGWSNKPSGFVIGTFCLGGWFEIQDGLPIEWENDSIIYEMPKIEI
jgi:hypothetical protein